MKIKLTGEFATSTGRAEIEIYGPTTIRGLLNALDGSFPNHGWGSCNVAVNGTMYTNAWSQPISENDEIVIMPPIEGGEMTSRERADEIWLVVKGRNIPEGWSDEQIEEIIIRYWHKAIARGEG